MDIKRAFAQNTDIDCSYHSFRLPQDRKVYYEYQMQEFANNLAARVTCDVKYIQFGKQDSRGALSITIFDHRHCVPMQRHFSSKDEMLGFIEGYNKACSNVTYIQGDYNMSFAIFAFITIWVVMLHRVCRKRWVWEQIMDTAIHHTDKEGRNYNKFNEQIIPCAICGKGTTMLGTKHCHRCHELDIRISMDLDIAERLVNYYRSKHHGN